MRLRYTRQAREDLRQIRAYFAAALQNPLAGERITARIVKSCGMLKEHPLLGLALSEKIARATDLRYLIQGNYLIFYRVSAEVVSVIRILDGRTDYLRLLQLGQDGSNHQ